MLVIVRFLCMSLFLLISPISGNMLQHLLQLEVERVALVPAVVEPHLAVDVDVVLHSRHQLCRQLEVNLLS
jgi:hypothetical protein